MRYGSSSFQDHLVATPRNSWFLAVAGVLIIGIASAQNPSQIDCSLSVAVHDAADRPLSDIAVEVRSTSPQERIRAFTKADGSLVFSGLRAAEYTVTVASSILLPPHSVRLENAAPSMLTFRLPITPPMRLGHESDLVSVQQLGLPPTLQSTIQKAFEAWFRMDTHQSRILANAALKIRAEYAPALTLLGMIDLKEGNPDFAIGELLEALRESPNSATTYLTLASAYNEQRDYTGALDALSVMSKLTPENWQLHYETGRAYLGQMRYQDAMQEFEHAQRSSSDDNIVVHLAKAHALTGMQNYAGARNELETIQRKSPRGIYHEESRELAEFIDSRTRPAAAGGGSPPPLSARIKPKR